MSYQSDSEKFIMIISFALYLDSVNQKTHVQDKEYCGTECCRD